MNADGDGDGDGDGNGIEIGIEDWDWGFTIANGIGLEMWIGMGFESQTIALAFWLLSFGPQKEKNLKLFSVAQIEPDAQHICVCV